MLDTFPNIVHLFQVWRWNRPQYNGLLSFELRLFQSRAVEKILIMKDFGYCFTNDLVEHLFLFIIKELLSNPIEVVLSNFSKYYSMWKWILNFFKKKSPVTDTCERVCVCHSSDYSQAFCCPGIMAVNEAKYLLFWNLLSSAEDRPWWRKINTGQRLLHLVLQKHLSHKL